MKTTLSFVLSLTFLFGKAQYASMFNNNQHWVGVIYGLAEIGYHQHIEGDSLIGAQTYKKVMSVNTFGSDEYLQALMREDVQSGRVYRWNGSEEILAYDFSLDVGETAVISGIGGDLTVVISSVETVQVNGNPRRKLNFDDAWTNAYWIEGLGSVYGPTDPVLGMVTDYGPVLNCYYESNELHWSNPQNPEPCDAQLSASDPVELEARVWPNPAKDFINVSWSSELYESELTYQLVALDGRVIKTGKLIGSGDHRVSLSNLNAGIYELSLSANKGQACYRIMIE